MPTPSPPFTLFSMKPVYLSERFSPRLMTRLQQLAQVDPTLVVQDFSDPAVADTPGRAEVLITGWGCPLYRLPNVFLTPHIAGSLGNEVAGLGGTVVTELERMTTGLPPAHPVHRAELAISA